MRIDTLVSLVAQIPKSYYLLFSFVALSSDGRLFRKVTHTVKQAGQRLTRINSSCVNKPSSFRSRMLMRDACVAHNVSIQPWSSGPVSS